MKAALPLLLCLWMAAFPAETRHHAGLTATAAPPRPSHTLSLHPLSLALTAIPHWSALGFTYESRNPDGRTSSVWNPFFLSNNEDAGGLKHNFMIIQVPLVGQRRYWRDGQEGWCIGYSVGGYYFKFEKTTAMATGDIRKQLMAYGAFELGFGEAAFGPVSWYFSVQPGLAVGIKEASIQGTMQGDSDESGFGVFPYINGNVALGYDF